MMKENDVTKQFVNITKGAREKVADFVFPEGRKEREFDKLTGIPNFSAFERAHERAKNDPELHVIMFDLNFFKRLNDNLGHPEGNSALQLVAQTLVEVAKTFGVSDRFVFRFGGDEFAIICPKQISGKLMEAVERGVDEQFANHPLPISISGSFGDNLTEAERHLQTNKDRRKRDC